MIGTKIDESVDVDTYDLCPCDTGEDDERELELDLHRSRCCWGVNLCVGES